MAFFPNVVRRAPALALSFVAIVFAAGASGATLTGQIVCSQCWFEADRDSVAYGSTEDLECAARCAAQGVGAALATRNDEGFALYLLEGAPPGGGSWVAWAGRFVRAAGRIATENQKPSFRAESVERLDESPWPQRASKPSGRPGHGDHARGIDDAEDAGDGAGMVWTDLRGGPVRLTDLQGRIVVLNFWATWCVPCKKEMPDLIELHDRFAPYRVEFVGAAADAPDQVEGVLAFARKQKINFPVVLGATTAQMEALGLPPVLPATVVLDEHGHAIDWFPGVIDRAVVAASLSSLLGLTEAAPPGKPVRVAGTPRPHDHGQQSHASLVPS